MLSQDDYKLWADKGLNFSTSQWKKVEAVASSRLADFLCLESLPDPLGDDLAMVLAIFIKESLAAESDDARIASKHIRNFTITFHGDSAANAFAKIANSYGDIVEKYSKCGLGITAERTVRRCCESV